MGNLGAVSQGDLCLANVDGDAAATAFRTNRGFSSILRNGVGDYSLTMTDAQALLTAGNVQATPNSATFLAVTVEVVSATVIRVRTWDAAGAAADGDFWVRVTPVSPV